MKCSICGSPLDAEVLTSCASCMMTPEELSEEDDWNQRNIKEDADKQNADWRKGYRS